MFSNVTLEKNSFTLQNEDLLITLTYSNIILVKIVRKVSASFQTQGT